MSPFAESGRSNTAKTAEFRGRFRPQADIGKINCRLTQPLLFGQRHFELDGRQLLRGLADTLQERQPARVGLDVGERGFDCNVSQARVVVGHRLVQPLEGPVGLTPERQYIGDVVGRILFVLFDQRRERRVGGGHLAQRVMRHRQADQAPSLEGLLLVLTS